MELFDTCRAVQHLALENSGRDNASTASSLVDKYPNAWRDFYPSRTPCVFKSGPSWPVHEGPEAYSIVREPRPVHNHPIQRTWLSIGKQIFFYLDFLRVKWTSIIPLAYAEAGQAKPFCPLIISISVRPGSLSYHVAVSAAGEVKNILAELGFAEIEVAFVEAEVVRSVATGSKLLSFPARDKIASLRKPFTTSLGLPIATFKNTNLEGTGSLYFRLNKGDRRVAVLTCAHVARPQSVHANTGLMRKRASQPREEIILLGTHSYNNAVNAIRTAISNLEESIEVWNRHITTLDPEDPADQATHQDNLRLIDETTTKIEAIRELRDEVTKFFHTLEDRTIGFVLHSEKIGVNVSPWGFTRDWALIELYDHKIDWSTFAGNKVFIGDKFSGLDFGLTMFPQRADRANFQYPRNGLLQANGVVKDDEIRNPQHLDTNGEKCLFAVKNGLTTGTTVGRVNGLESFTRTYDYYGIMETSTEIAVFSLDIRGVFSARGDSGSVVLARDGRIIGILTGGLCGATDELDITFLTPYWWVEQQIKAKYPGCFLYDIVQ